MKRGKVTDKIEVTVEVNADGSGSIDVRAYGGTPKITYSVRLPDGRTINGYGEKA